MDNSLKNYGEAVNAMLIALANEKIEAEKRQKCIYCGNKFTEDVRGNCSSCGAPRKFKVARVDV